MTESQATASPPSSPVTDSPSDWALRTRQLVLRGRGRGHPQQLKAWRQRHVRFVRDAPTQQDLPLGQGSHRLPGRPSHADQAVKRRTSGRPRRRMSIRGIPIWGQRAFAFRTPESVCGVQHRLARAAGRVPRAVPCGDHRG